MPSHNHTHKHCHNHSHNHSHNSRGLLIVLVLTTLYMFAEFFGGLYTNSLALTADAGHMLGDVGALALSYFALWLAKRPAPSEKTFGYYRAEIFAALVNGATLVVIALVIIYEAYLRILNPLNVKSSTMIIIATGGLLVNVAGAFILHKDSKENLNMKGAFLHVIGDLLGSIGAIIAGVLIFKWQLYIADPIISFVIAGFVLINSVNLVNSAVRVLMETAPENLDTNEIKGVILAVENVIDVHDLHVWSIDSNNVSLSVHIVAKDINNQKILCEVNNLLKEQFEIEHSTIQLEPEGFHEFGCPLDFH